MYTLIATAKLNGINPQAWLADVLARIADHPAPFDSDGLPRPRRRLQAGSHFGWPAFLPT
jgi:transposase